MINEKKITHAVANMCRELGISGSISGKYDLYAVVRKEIIKRCKIWKMDKIIL